MQLHTKAQGCYSSINIRDLNEPISPKQNPSTDHDNHNNKNYYRNDYFYLGGHVVLLILLKITIPYHDDHAYKAVLLARL